MLAQAEVDSSSKGFETINVQTDAFIIGVCHRLLRFRTLKLLKDDARARSADFQDCSMCTACPHPESSCHARLYCCFMQGKSCGSHARTPAGRDASPRLVVNACMSDKSARLAALYAEYKGQFPNVKAITARQLNVKLHSPSEKDIMLLDVRTPDEQKVSRLPGNVLSTDTFETVKSKTSKSTPIVTYWCEAAMVMSACMPVQACHQII